MSSELLTAPTSTRERPARAGMRPAPVTVVSPLQRLRTGAEGTDHLDAAVDRAIRPVLAFADAINRGDVDAAVAELAPSALHYGRISNYQPDGVQVLFTMLRTVLPDLRLDISELSVSGNRVTSHIVATGTHTGSFLGKPATGRTLTWNSVDVAEVGEVDGADTSYWKVLRRFWDLWADPGLWKEIGFTPAIMC